jgi:hypothetical protein
MNDVSLSKQEDCTLATLTEMTRPLFGDCG